MILQSERVFIGSVFMKAQIRVENGKIVEVYPYNSQPVDVDYHRKRIVPGFYDVHAHGYLGYDTDEGGRDGLIRWLKDLPKEGVCGIVPTTLTQSHEVLCHALSEIASVKQEIDRLEAGTYGADILGIHLEGPFLNEKYKGAQPKKYIASPSVEEFVQFQEAASGLIRIMTLAPEHDKEYALTRFASSQNVNVSLGHTDASFEEALMAVSNGAKGFTHTFNAMSPFTHRKEGVAGASLACKDVFSEIIADGNHTGLMALKLFFREKGLFGMVVSDSLRCKGLEQGKQYDFGGQPIEIYPDGSAHIATGDKQLAGSTLRINQALRILVEEALIPQDEAIYACSLNPCRYLGLDDHKGRICSGYDADLVVLNDDYSVAQTYCIGIPQL